MATLKHTAQLRELHMFVLMSGCVWLLALPLSASAQEQKDDAAPPSMAAQAPDSADKEVVEEQNQGGTPELSFTETEHDFGTVWTGTSLEYAFEVKNTGDAPLNILKVKPSCGCTLAGQFDSRIEPAGVGKIPIKVKSKNLKNKFTKSIRVESDDPKRRVSSLKITGFVKQYVEAEPAYIRFGRLKPNEERTQTLSIKNNSDRPLELTVPDNIDGIFTTEVVEKSKGQEYEIKITSKPPFGDGRRSNAQLRIQTNIPQQPELRIRTIANILPRIQIQPERLIIPRAASGETTKKIIVTNQLDSPVHLTAAEVNDEKIKVTTNVLEEGKRYEVAVVLPPDYMPDAKGETLTLRFDDPQNPTETVPITRNIQRRRQRPAMQLVGQQAPELEFTTQSGKLINTGHPEAEVTILKFYASWCGFCKKSLPEIEKLHQKYKDKPVEIVAMNLDDPNDRNPRKRFTPEQSMEKLKELGVTFDVAFDPENKIRVPFKVTSFPTMFVLDKTGKVSNVYVGAITGPRIEQLTGDIESLLAKPKEVTKAKDAEKERVSGTR